MELMDFFVAITTKQLKICLAYRKLLVFGVIKLISKNKDNFFLISKKSGRFF
jgi:hypothetical protein